MIYLLERIKIYSLNYSPQHPSARCVPRLVLDLNGRLVTNLQPTIEFLYRETGDLIMYKRFLSFFNRLDFMPACTQKCYFVLTDKKWDSVNMLLRAHCARVFLFVNNTCAIVCFARQILLKCFYFISKLDIISFFADIFSYGSYYYFSYCHICQC